MSGEIPRDWKLPLLSFLFTVLATLAAGQTQTGGIEGRVVDGTGAVVPGVTVTLDSPVLLTPKTTTTSDTGRYAFINLVPGSYNLSFELQGFQTVRREGLIVSVARTITIDATMQLASVSEVVTVVGETPLVDRTATNVGTNLDQGLLQEIPTSRDVWSILQTQAPQVVLDREDVGGSEGGLQAVFSANGSTWHQNTYSVNGVNTGDPAATGATMFYFDYDSFEEVQISTGSHTAEVATPGVYLNLVTKTGKDTFNGGAAYYYENSSMVSDNIDQALKDAGVERGSSINLFSDFTGQLGGPIIKDKFRFYTSWRDWRIHRDVVNFPLSENTDLFSGLGNFSYQINPRNQVTALYTVQTYWKPHRNASALVRPEATWIEDDTFSIVQGAWHSSLSNQALADARVSYSSISFPLRAQSDATEAGNFDLATGVWSRAAPFGYFDQFRNRLSLNGALTYFADQWMGSHEFKFGLEFQQAGDENETTYLRDLTTYTLDNSPAFVAFRNTPYTAKQRFHELNAFAQDSWNPAQRLTLNLGLRFSATRGYNPAQGAPAGEFFPARDFPRQDVISWNTLAPRLGLVYDIRGDGKHAAKVSYGRYYHVISTGYISGVNQNGGASRFYAWNDQNGDGVFQIGEEGDLLSVSGGSNTKVDPNLKQPFTDEFIAGVENELPHRFRLDVNFTYRRKSDLAGFINQGVPDSAYDPVGALDPGRDGIPGTSDDQSITVFNRKPQFAGQDLDFETNPTGFNGHYKGLEITGQKRFADRWQFLGSWTVSKSTLQRTAITIGAFGGEEEGAGGIGYNPTGVSAYDNPNSGINQNGESDFYDRTHVIKLAASYILPKLDVNLAGIYKHQTGTPYGRILTVTEDASGNAFNQGPISLFAEPRGTYRFPSLNYVDFRASKIFRFERHELEFIFDVFNLTNTNVVTELNVNSGAVFQDPTNVFGPRVIRLGGRWRF